MSDITSERAVEFTPEGVEELAVACDRWNTIVLFKQVAPVLREFADLMRRMTPPEARDHQDALVIIRQHEARIAELLRENERLRVVVQDMRGSAYHARAEIDQRLFAIEQIGIHEERRAVRATASVPEVTP